MREFLPGDARQRERAYSPAVKVNGGTTLYLAGYGAFQDEAGKSYAGDFDGQVRLSFERIRKTLEIAGGKLDDIVTMTVFITDIRDSEQFLRIRKETFGDNFPASALIEITALVPPQALIEIQAIAVVA